MARNTLKIIIYAAKDGTRWHMKRAGRIVAESGEAYERHSGAAKAVSHLVKVIQAGSIMIEDLTLKPAK